jgi:hypothetical protein
VVVVAAFAVALFITAIGVAYAAPTINEGVMPPSGHYTDSQCTSCHNAKSPSTPPPASHYDNVCTDCHTVNQVGAACSLSMVAAPTAIVYGSSVAIRGTLSSGGSGLPGRTDVQVMRRLGTTGAWTADGMASWDATAGAYRASRKAYKNTTFMLRFPGDTIYAPVDSAGRYVQVKCWMPKPTVPLVARRNVYFGLTGYMKPRVPATTRTTRLLIYRRVGARWVLFSQPLAVNYGAGTMTRYSARLRIATAGYYRIQGKGVVSGLVTTLSTPAYVTVR